MMEYISLFFVILSGVCFAIGMVVSVFGLIGSIVNVVECIVDWDVGASCWGDVNRCFVFAIVSLILGLILGGISFVLQ